MGKAMETEIVCVAITAGGEAIRDDSLVGRMLRLGGHKNVTELAMFP